MTKRKSSLGALGESLVYLKRLIFEIPVQVKHWRSGNTYRHRTNMDTLNVGYDQNGFSQVNAMAIANDGKLLANYSITSPSLGGETTISTWGYWRDYYYPQVIRESYPVYIKERAEDKGKQAFEIIKAMQDKKLMQLEKVSDFIEAMDTLIKIL